MSEIVLYLIVIVGLLGAAWYFWKGVKRDKAPAYTEEYEGTLSGDTKSSYTGYATRVGNSSPSPSETGETTIGKPVGLGISRSNDPYNKRRSRSRSYYNDDSDYPYVVPGPVAYPYSNNESDRQVQAETEATKAEFHPPPFETPKFEVPNVQSVSDSAADTLQRASDVLSSGGQSGGGSGDYGHHSGGSAGGSSGFDSSLAPSYSSGSDSGSSSGGYDSGSSSSSYDSGSSSSSYSSSD